jgi:glycosyltransferase involved in cell wall biosynthesis
MGEMSADLETASVEPVRHTFLIAPVPPTPPARGPIPSFSVVIAAYQAHDLVREAAESALRQNVAPHEVIVCDDGSTDGTAEAVADLREDVVLLRREHRGVAAAKNVCLRAATGDFVVILDADNVLLPECLELMGEAAATRPDLDIISSDAYLELDGRIYDRYYRKKARFVTTDQRRGALHQHFIYGQAAVRCSHALAVGGYDEQLERGVDTDLFLRLILSGSRAGLIAEPLSRYRLRTGSLSSSRAKSMRAMIDILERARTHPSLTPAEHAFLDADLREKERLTVLIEAEDALRSRRGDARHRCWRVASSRTYAPRTRAKAALAGVAPGTAAALLHRRERHGADSRLALRTRGR